MSPVKYELGSCMPEGDILNSHRRQQLKCYRPRADGWVSQTRHESEETGPHTRFNLPRSTPWHLFSCSSYEEDAANKIRVPECSGTLAELYGCQRSGATGLEPSSAEKFKATRRRVGLRLS
jgi:hypothetical protein